MNKLTKNLYRTEFECKCGCGQDTVDFVLINVLQNEVDHFQKLHPTMRVSIHINSGNRCVKHNGEIGGSDNSMHLYGKAADHYLYDKITKARIHSDKVADYLEARYPDSYGIGRYESFTHVDVKGGIKRRWDFR